MSETGKVASSVVDTFKGNPALFTVALLAAFFGALTFYGLQRDIDRRAKTTELLLDRCIPYVAEHQQGQRP